MIRPLFFLLHPVRKRAIIQEKTYGIGEKT